MKRQTTSEILLATTDTLEGKRIVEYLGLVRGFCSEAEARRRDPPKKVTPDVFTDEARTAMLREDAARTEGHFRTAFGVALGNLCKEAKGKGANAVVGLCVNTAEQFAIVFTVIVIGTAVRYEET